ncbi:MAG TPA: pyruvoyl-dependent arginine decarboxylase [Acidimicrobiales bacterium]
MTLITHPSRAQLPRQISASTRTIALTSAVGSGATVLSAFDAALDNAGIGNFNLIQLSSVIPAGSSILDLDGAAAAVTGEWGDRLYVVMAKAEVDLLGEEAWAGIGWVQQQHSRKGLFVEHHGSAKADLQSEMVNSLGSMCEKRGEQFESTRYHLRGTTCAGKPVCALVVAIFEPQAWVSDWAPPPGLQPLYLAGPGEVRSQSQVTHSVAGSIRRAQARWRHRRT